MTGIFMISLTTSVRRRSRATSLPGSRRGFRAAPNQAPMTDFRRCKQSMLRTDNRPHYRSFAPMLAWLVVDVPATTELYTLSLHDAAIVEVLQRLLRAVRDVARDLLV